MSIQTPGLKSSGERRGLLASSNPVTLHLNLAGQEAGICRRSRTLCPDSSADLPVCRHHLSSRRTLGHLPRRY